MKILQIADNGVTQVEAPDEVSAKKFLDETKPLPTGWKWVSDGIDYGKKFYWFHECNQEVCQHQND